MENISCTFDLAELAGSISHENHLISNKMSYGSMKETKMPPACAANLVANNDNTEYGTESIEWNLIFE